MSEILLSVKHLKKNFPIKSARLFKPQRYVRAVDNVSFEIAEGEIMGLVGESGSGKTTTGETIMCLTEPTGGSVTFNGHLIFDVEKGKKAASSDLKEIRRSMQMVFQDPYASLDPRMNIESIITEGLIRIGMYKGSSVHDRAVELVQECGLDADCLAKYPHQFSGGQRQRIGIARAISINPKLLICDEPTAALDVSVQSQVLNLMLSLREKHNMSYLFITHNLNIVRHFCNRVCVMYLGSIVEIAEASKLFSDSAHPYTQALLESSPSIQNPKRGCGKLLSGEIPSPSSPPSGCKFHTRCFHASARCTDEEPVLHDIGGGHMVCCHLFE